MEWHRLIINDALNLVLPVRSNEDGEPLIWAHHTPISTDVFRANYRIIAETNAAIWGKGIKYAATAGARIANLTLLDISKADAQEHGIEDAGPALLAEIKRLTLILAPGANGFETLPVDVAIARKVIDADDWDEAEGSLCFFTAAFHLAKRAGRKKFSELIASVIAGSTTSLGPTEYGSSLRQSTPVNDSIEIVSSEPS